MSTKTRKNRKLPKRALVLFFIVAAFGSIALYGILDARYYQTSPRTPQIDQGKVHPEHVHHGALVYLTRTERLVYEYAPAICVVLFGTGIFLHRVWKLEKNLPE